MTETALREHFEQFFTIRDVKVIRSPEGISKGYGFVTFDTEDEAKAVQAMVCFSHATLNLKRDFFSESRRTEAQRKADQSRSSTAKDGAF